MEMQQQATPQLLEEVLRNLLVPDGTVVQQYTQVLKSILNLPEGPLLLGQVLQGSQEEGVRQLAAVVLRRRVKKIWKQTPNEVKNEIRELLLRQAVCDPSKTVKHSVASVISAIAKYDIPDKQWPHLMVWVNKCIQSQDVGEKEIGMFVLSALCETIGSEMLPFVSDLFGIFTAMLNDHELPAVQDATIKAVTELMGDLGSSELHLVHNIMPAIMNVVKNRLKTDEAEAVEDMQFFDELMDLEAPLKWNQISAMVGFFLEVAANTELEQDTRVMALNWLVVLVNREAECLGKHGAVGEIMHQLFAIMSQPEADEKPDEESVSLAQCSAQVFDAFALKLDPKIVLGPALELVAAKSQSPDANERRAAMTILMVMAEGCSEALRKILDDVLVVLFRGMDDPEISVRESACLALSQFSKYMQPDISKHCEAVLPRLFAAFESPNNSFIEKSCYALQVFAEQLGDQIVPYMPVMVTQLHNLLASGSREVQEVAILALAAVAHSAGKSFEPYVADVSNMLKHLMTLTSEETVTARAHATDTMGVVVKAVPEYFQNGLPELMALANSGFALDDPEIAQCTFGLWGFLADVFKGNMAPYVAEMLPFIMAAIESTEGIVEHRKSDGEPLDIGSDDEEEEEGNVESCTIVLSYMDAKEAAIECLADLAKHLPEQFVQLVEPTLPTLLGLLDYTYSADVKCAAATTLLQYIETINIVYPPAAPFVPGLPVAVPLSSQTMAIVTETMPKLIRMLVEDDDRTVVLRLCEALVEMLPKVGPGCVANWAEDWVSAVGALVTGNASCQKSEEEVDDQAERSIAEYDAMLLEAACDLLGATAKLFGRSFAGPCMDRLGKELLRFSRKTSSDSEWSVCMATCADIIEGLGESVVQYVPTLFPALLKGLGHPEGEVRSNAAFAMGLLAQNSKQALYPQYLAVLRRLHLLFSQDQEPATIDNAAGCLSRMILAGCDHLPLAEIMPILLDSLPLKSDFEENDAVMGALIGLLRTHNPVALQMLPRLLAIFSHTLANAEKELKPAIQNELVQTIKVMRNDFPTEFHQAASMLSLEAQQIVDAALQS